MITPMKHVIFILIAVATFSCNVEVENDQPEENIIDNPVLPDKVKNEELDNFVY